MNFNDQLETLGHCLNVRIFEITSVRIRANVDVAQISSKSTVIVPQASGVSNYDGTILITISPGPTFCCSAGQDRKSVV